MVRAYWLSEGSDVAIHRTVASRGCSAETTCLGLMDKNPTFTPLAGVRWWSLVVLVSLAGEGGADWWHHN